MKMTSLAALIVAPVTVLASIAPAQAAPDPPDTGTMPPPCIRTVRGTPMWKFEGTSSTNYTWFHIKVSSKGCMASGSVQYTTDGGSAVQWFPLSKAWDYEKESGTLTFTAGDSADKYVSVKVHADAFVESDDNFYLQLHSPTGGVRVSSCNPAPIWIDNDDPVPPAPTGPGYYCPE